MKDLSKIKTKWGITVLEGEDSTELFIEDRFKIIVPSEYWECFQGIFADKLKSGTCLNLSMLLTEAVADDMRGLRKRLKPALAEMYGEQRFASLDKVISVWKAEFKTDIYRTRGQKGPVVSHERKGKDIQQLYSKLLRAYGEDKVG